MARGRHYAKLSLSNAARLSFSDLCILLFMFLSLCRLCVCVFLCSHWSLVDVPLIFFCPADHVPDWQPRVLLGMVEARSVNVKKTTTTTTTAKNLNDLDFLSCCFSHIGCQPGKTTLHSGQSRSWSAEQGNVLGYKSHQLILQHSVPAFGYARFSLPLDRSRLRIFIAMQVQRS